MERFFDKPIARITALIGVPVVILSLIVSSLAVWPDTWWPRRTPPLNVYVSPYANNSTLYAVATDANSIQGAPTSGTNVGCRSEARHRWAWAISGYAAGNTTIFINVVARRRDTSVLIVDFKPTLRRIPGNFGTGLFLCAEDYGAGGAYYFERTINVSYFPNKQEVSFANEKGEELKQLGVLLAQGDSASFMIQPDLEEPGAAYEWMATMEILVNGKPEKIRVPTEGFFRIADLSDDPTYWADTANPVVCNPHQSPHDWCHQK